MGLVDKIFGKLKMAMSEVTNNLIGDGVDIIDKHISENGVFSWVIRLQSLDNKNDYRDIQVTVTPVEDKPGYVDMEFVSNDGKSESYLDVAAKDIEYYCKEVSKDMYGFETKFSSTFTDSESAKLEKKRQRDAKLEAQRQRDAQKAEQNNVNSAKRIHVKCSKIEGSEELEIIPAASSYALWEASKDLNLALDQGAFDQVDADKCYELTVEPESFSVCEMCEDDTTLKYQTLQNVISQLSVISRQLHYINNFAERACSSAKLRDIVSSMWFIDDQIRTMAQLSIELYHSADYPQSSEDEIISISEIDSESCIDRITMEMNRLIDSYQFMYSGYTEDIQKVLDDCIRNLSRTVNFILQ